jgi:hypothetical protein
MSPEWISSFFLKVISVSEVLGIKIQHTDSGALEREVPLPLSKSDLEPQQNREARPMREVKDASAPLIELKCSRRGVEYKETQRDFQALSGNRLTRSVGVSKDFIH